MTRARERASPAVPTVVRPRRSGPSSPRAGVTLVELLIVLVLLGTASALAAPKTMALLRSARTASARRQLAAAAEAARAGAIQRQRPATVQVVAVKDKFGAVTGATVTASVDTGGAQPYVVSRQTLAVPAAPRAAGDTSVTYDARGLLTPRRTSPPTPVIYLLGAAGGGRDSVCLSPYGHILPRDCAP